MSGSTPSLYDSIGVGCSGQRRTDPRIGSQIHRALGSAATVLNVGAGTGSYEPADERGLGLAKLRRDLDSGAWAQRYGDLLALDAADCGYRLAISPGTS